MENFEAFDQKKVVVTYKRRLFYTRHFHCSDWENFVFWMGGCSCLREVVT